MRIKSVILAYSIEYYLKRYGLDIENFLLDNDLLKYKIFKYIEDMILNKFIACYKYTL